MRSRFWATRVAPEHGWSNGQVPSKEVWLRVEWRIGEAEPTKYYLCVLPQNLSLKRLVAIARGRWRGEQDYQQLKEELGLDHLEGRGWTGWHYHVTLGDEGPLVSATGAVAEVVLKNGGRCRRLGVSGSSCSEPGVAIALTAVQTPAVHRHLTE